MISKKKLEAAINNLQKATLKNRERVFEIWRCKQCGKEEKATVHRMRNKYCSNKCVSDAYKDRMKGNSNPNYKNAGEKICECCGNIYRNYSKDSKFCSPKCFQIEANQLRTSAKKDANHNEIVNFLKDGGVIVLDTSRVLFGFPDLVVWYKNLWHLIEIKNPKTSYGKKGLNKQQEKWALDWQGGPVIIIRTKEDVDFFLDLKFEKLETIGGYNSDVVSPLRLIKSD